MDRNITGRKSFFPDVSGAYCLLVFAVFVFLGGERALRDADTLWHIKAGERMIELKEVLRVDIFSHTAYGQPWTAHEWMAEIIMASVHKAAGLSGVVIVFALLVSFTFLILFQAARRFGGEWTSIASVSIALSLAYTHYLARPHLFSWLFGAITLNALLRGGRILFLLPPVTLLWANIHGGFFLGIILQGIFLAGAVMENWPGADVTRWKGALKNNSRALGVLIMSVLAVGFNPFGYDLLLFPFRVMRPLYMHGIQEWMSPNMYHFWHFRLYVLLIIFLLAIGRKAPSWTEKLLILFFMNAALVQSRNISLAGIYLTPFMTRVLQEESGRWSFLTRRTKGREMILSRSSGPLVTVMTACLLLAGSASGYQPWQNLSGTIAVLPKKFSEEAVTYLEKNPPRGNVFNEYSWGGFLIYSMELKVFIDGRADMYGEEIFGDYQKIARLDPEAEDLLRKYDISWIIYPADKPLTRYLKVTGGWDEVYLDEEVSILVRLEPSPS